MQANIKSSTLVLTQWRYWLRPLGNRNSLPCSLLSFFKRLRPRLSTTLQVISKQSKVKKRFDQTCQAFLLIVKDVFMGHRSVKGKMQMLQGRLHGKEEFEHLHFSLLVLFFFSGTHLHWCIVETLPAVLSYAWRLCELSACFNSTSHVAIKLRNRLKRVKHGGFFCAVQYMKPSACETFMHGLSTVQLTEIR